MAEVKAKRGRPSLYTPELALEICERLAQGESLRSICQDEHMPDHSTVCMWAVEDKGGFYNQYTRAREVQYLGMADELTDISDDGRNDWMTKTLKNGEEIEVVNKEVVDRSKLRVETRKWILSKMLPKVYGDKVQVEQKIGFTEEFENYMRELKGQKARIIDGRLADNGAAVEVLPVPLRSGSDIPA